MKRFQLMQSTNPECLYPAPRLNGNTSRYLLKVCPRAKLEEAEMEATYHCCVAANLLTVLWRKDRVCHGFVVFEISRNALYRLDLAGKVSMSVLTKGVVRDFVHDSRKDMATSSNWPASMN